MVLVSLPAAKRLEVEGRASRGDEAVVALDDLDGAPPGEGVEQYQSEGIVPVREHGHESMSVPV